MGRRSCILQPDAAEQEHLLSDLRARSKILDVLRLLFAVCVVAVHTHALESWPESWNFWITQAVFRLAVPFFFVTSGFFLGRKLYGQNQETFSVIRGYTRHLLYPLVCVEGANAVIELLTRRLVYGSSLIGLAGHFVKHVLFYPYGAMWFVQACIMGAWILFPFLKRGKIDVALLVSGILYSWALLCNNYYFLAEDLGLAGTVNTYMNLFISARNGVFVGPFFLALGIKTWECYSLRADLRWGRFLFAVAVVLYVAEIYATRFLNYLDDRALYVTQALLVPLLIYNVADIRIPLSDGSAVRMQKASQWLYYSHRLVYALGGLLCILITGNQWRGPGAFLTVLTIETMGFFVMEAFWNIKRRW